MQDVISELKLLNDKSIAFTLSFVYGHPQETREDFEQTLELAIASKTFLYCESIQIHKLAPLSGSELHQAVHKEIVFDGYISDQSKLFDVEMFEECIRANAEIFASFYSIPSDFFEQIHETIII